MEYKSILTDEQKLKYIKSWFSYHPEKARGLRNRKILEFDGKFSIGARYLRLYINDIECDISEIIPWEIWNIEGSYQNPEDNWKTRNELSLMSRMFLSVIDREFVEKSSIVF